MPFRLRRGGRVTGAGVDLLGKGRVGGFFPGRVAGLCDGEGGCLDRGGGRAW